jgi:hypothetical protein
MRARTVISQAGSSKLPITGQPLGRCLRAHAKPRRCRSRPQPFFDHHASQALSTHSRPWGILVIAHSVSPEVLLARHKQLLRSRSNGQPLERSQVPQPILELRDRVVHIFLRIRSTTDKSRSQYLESVAWITLMNLVIPTTPNLGRAIDLRSSLHAIPAFALPGLQPRSSPQPLRLGRSCCDNPMTVS